MWAMAERLCFHVSATAKPSSRLIPHKRFSTRVRSAAEKKSDGGDSEPIGRKIAAFPGSISKSLAAQSAAALLGLGVVDAGYSGDWSRINVITNETEEMLKLAAFFIVPMCLFFIYSISKGEEKA